MASRENPEPWHIESQTIRDANGYVVVSAINPCGMATRRRIVRAVNEKTVGNAAAMREALEWLLGFGYSTTDGGFHMPNAKMAMNRIEAALAAPLRNCDRCATLGEAVMASGMVSAEAPGLTGMSNAQIIAFVKWLFATAKESEADDGK